jgi:hypothetical protein
MTTIIGYHKVRLHIASRTSLFTATHVKCNSSLTEPNPQDTNDLLDIQQTTEQKVYQIWTVLSAFEGEHLLQHDLFFFTLVPSVSPKPS